MRRWVAALILALAATSAAAHEPSHAYLDLEIEGAIVSGRLDLALRDLEVAIGLDADGDGAITWGELRARERTIAAYAFARLPVFADGRPCRAEADGLRVEDRPEGTYAVLDVTAPCDAPIRSLDLTYGLLFDLDPQHRGLATVRWADNTSSNVFAPEHRSWRIDPAGPSALTTLGTYFREGVHHIWIGIYHVLFLVSLLLPTVGRFQDRRWQPARSLRGTCLQVIGIVSAFTLAHSITLALAVFGWLSLPPRLIESVIAASIVLAALNNIVPLVSRGLPLVAFGFGLVHGLGFAGALQELGLPSGQQALAILSFNLGVELGQVVIVTALLPLAFLLGRSSLYQPLVLRPASLAIAAWALVWLVERALPLA